MIQQESNTIFASLLSQKTEWDVYEVGELAQSILKPFDGLNVKQLEASIDYDMAHTISGSLNIKLDCYKPIVRKISENDGLSILDLSINVFNVDCGVDSIAFLYALKNKGYDIGSIKCVRLFEKNVIKLQRALLLHHYLFPNANVHAFNLGLEDISDECSCDTLMTINVFPQTCNYKNGIAKTIGDLLIHAHQIYSHSIFAEFIPFNDNKKQARHAWKYYLQDLEMTRVSKVAPVNGSVTPLVANYPIETSYYGGRCIMEYGIFSNLSIETLTNEHEYPIILEDLCPGVPVNKLFNTHQRVLYFDKPFEGKLDNESIDDTNAVVISDDIFSLVGSSSYTLKSAIEEFPQYQIAEGLDNKEEWAQKVYDYYQEKADGGYTVCYNNLAVISMLRESMSDDFYNLSSPIAKEIINLLELASNSGDVNAMLNLASFYMARESYQNAITYYELSSENSSAPASYFMGVLYHFGLYDREKNIDKAIKYYKRSILQYKEEDTSDGKSYTPISDCAQNLILLMYQMGDSLCEIDKVYSDVEKPSESLVYAYTVISNNLSNRSKNFFRVMKFLSPEEKEPSYISYNRIVALYKGVRNGNNHLASNKKEALNQLKELSKRGCKDWPDWERYIWPTLAKWSNAAKENANIYTTYWIKSMASYPERICAYRTNMALSSNLSDEEQKSIWLEFAYGKGCDHCHECTNYDLQAKCCPKAQYRWATQYEKDKNVAQYLLSASARQGFLKAQEKLSIHQVKDMYLSNVEYSVLDVLYLSLGINIPPTYKKIIDKYIPDDRYNSLVKTADNGSSLAKYFLAKVTELRNDKFPMIYWKSIASSCQEKVTMLQKLSSKSILGDFFYPSTLIERDLVKYADKLVGQLGENDEDGLSFLKQLAEFYVKGKNHEKAVELYTHAHEKGYDVTNRLTELKNIIAEEERERRSVQSYEDDYDYPSYGRYAGTYAQDEAGYSDEAIDDAFDGDPDAYWNID